jgi:hypothetical protein
MADDPQSTYEVFVDDNFHYRDESERYRLGSFTSCQAAIERCKQIVDDYLLDAYKPGLSAAELYSSYQSFGEDPWIASSDSSCTFSAWGYAKQRCKELCREEF